ncbi:gamma carbonic anhydrase family protein [Lampropedia aestuarii]|uniref:Gamma carbonic anhydrase family protein n=1 Tax=Lampropedia aestuarii TaxID=2562762 RepID=A0A4S5BRU1_9BURK|nr:gamma carbonic anhydrase family protein [Lampropedia aestuarii]THJ32578.1 gamma carbonic anhydrase family protein [Lampropedia aestuarii]
MPVWKLNGAAPQCAEDVFIAPGAQVVGQVTLEQGVSVWFNAVVRADNEPMHIGAHSNIQDGAVLHSDPGFPLVIGQSVTVGHQATVHGCTVGDGSLIGIGAVVLNGAVIGKNCLVGAGAVVTEGKVFPDRSLIVGAPAVLKRELSEEMVQHLQGNADHYVRNSQRYAEYLELLEPAPQEA